MSHKYDVNSHSNYYFSYGDECCEGRVSLLHFCVVLLLAGITILIVGAVQYKEEAELFRFRKIIISVGLAILGTGYLYTLIDNIYPFPCRFLSVLHKMCLFLSAKRHLKSF